MTRIIHNGFVYLFLMALVSSCAAGGVFKSDTAGTTPEAKHIKADKVPIKMQVVEDQKTISGLRAALDQARENEAVLNEQIVELQQEIEDTETVLNAQILQLKKEIDEKDNIISIQGKVIGLLDDADKTLQKSIEDQINNK